MPARLELPSRRPFALSDLSLPGAIRIAVAAPHPDDFDAIAVTMRWFHSRGDAIQLAVLTRGTSGIDDGFDGAHSPEEKTLVREREQRESCRLFGLEASAVRFLRLHDGADGKLALSEQNRDAVRQFLLDVRPDIVFLPHGKDTNVAHQRTHQLVTSIVEADQLSVLLCFNEDPKTIEIRRDLVVGFDEAQAKWKAMLLRAHASQQERNIRTRGSGFDERILAANRESAEQAGAGDRYAECFEVMSYLANQ